MQITPQFRPFWIILSAAALIAAIGSYFLFPRAFPLIHINLTMSRTEALNQANKIAQQFNLGPKNPSMSASFTTDETVKTFVELEGGGKNAFVAMMQDKLYQPYTWTVRLFEEFDPHEAHVWFTPEGVPYRFMDIISEDTPGASLTRDAAQTIAQNIAAAAPFHINFAEYTLIEASQEEQPSKRMDHTFVYERPTIKLGEGRYRLRLVVKGDTVCEINHFVKVPDEFLRRYKEMRSANEMIAAIARMIFMLLYVMGGCVIGLYLLFRGHWVIWKTALAWAAFITGLNTLQMLNQLPLQWMSYYTALSRSSFLFQYGLSLIMGSIFWFFFLFIVFMAAESLTRRAFPNHMQVWSLWRPQIASSHAVLGRTIAGYLMVPIALFFTCIFYVATTALWNWWTPSSALFNPDILATYFPWWQSIAVSLQAGFMEECLFRAVPLACAALLGERYGKKSWWIAGGMIVQALVFGAAHANYPAQPAYARLVELFGFSTAMGFVYLVYGLAPVIITHFVYDVVWFALPLFVSHSAFAWINQGMVIMLALIPLWIVLFARLRMGSWRTIAHEVYNYAWTPTIEEHHETPPIIPTIVTPSRTIYYGITAAATLGAILFIVFTPWKHSGLSFSITRSQARTLASEYLEQHNIHVADWHILAFPAAESDRVTSNFQHRFVWQNTSKDTYHSLLSSYLTPPHWLVRFVKFKGTISERAEEYRLYLTPQGTVFRFEHIIPESEQGKQLTQEQARRIAYKAVEEQFGLKKNDLAEVSAIATKHPNRLDWLFTLSTTQGYSLETGQARINVVIGGDQVLDIYRFIHVPEEWSRTQVHTYFIMSLLTQASSLILYFLLLIGIFFVYRGTTIRIRPAIPYLIAIGILGIIEVINALPKIMMYFNTSQPFFDQLFRSVGFELIFTMLYGILIAFKISAINAVKTQLILPRSVFTLLLGYGIGIIFAGTLATLFYFIPSAVPLWPSYAALAQTLPLIGTVATTIMQYLATTVVLLLVMHLITILTQSGTQRMILAWVLTIVSMTCLITIATATLSRALIAGPLLGIMLALLYYVILRFDLALVPLITGSFFVISLAQNIVYNAYPHAIPIALATAGILIIISWGWYALLSRD